MVPKLKLKASVPSMGDGASPTSGSTASPGGAGGFRLKLSTSVPPTPASETPAPFAQSAQLLDKTGGINGASKKRQADDDISPAPKKPSLKSRISIKVPPSSRGTADNSPGSALNKIKLNRKKSTGPKLTGLFASKGRPVPKRKPGEGYDSEDSGVEEDPAIQQGLILRMQPCDDADYLRTAITDGKVGIPKNEGGAEVTIRFLTADFRRAVVRVRTRLYAAVLVDLPCIIESMKSWDRKGWWKVSDVSQMLFVLGPCQNEEEAKSMPLPREIERETWQYAHGLTPPMHWVRKRRFRKRADHRTMANVEEEVERLLREDEEVEREGGAVEVLDHDLVDREQSYDQSQYDDEEDAELDAYETVENDGEQYQEFSEMDMDPNVEDNLEDDLQAAFDANFDEGAGIAGLMTTSPTRMEDTSPIVEMDHGTAEQSTAVTPAATPGGEVPPTSDDDDEDESDEDEDENSPEVVDEDAAARAAEKAQQLEEVADIEREIVNSRARAGAMTNQLLRNRELSKLQVLERELRMKKENFGLLPDD